MDVEEVIDAESRQRGLESCDCHSPASISILINDALSLMRATMISEHELSVQYHLPGTSHIEPMA